MEKSQNKTKQTAQMSMLFLWSGLGGLWVTCSFVVVHIHTCGCCIKVHDDSLNRALQKSSVIQATSSQENNLFQNIREMPILAFGLDRRQLYPPAGCLTGIPGASWGGSSSTIFTLRAHITSHFLLCSQC